MTRSVSLSFNNGCNPAHTTCQDYTQPKSPSAASHGCVLQIDSLWEIIKTRCSFLMDNSLQKSAQGIANSSTILPYSEWITGDVYCPELQWAKCFSSVWYQFALISSSILLFYYPNNENAALSSLQLNPTWSISVQTLVEQQKENCRAFWLFAATNNLLWKQKESCEDWRTLPEDIFPILTLSLPLGYYLWQLNSFGFLHTAYQELLW